MPLRPLATLLAFFTASALAQAPADDPANRWDLTELYPSQEAWNADAAKLAAQRQELLACKGRMGRDAASLRRCLDLSSEATKRLYRMYSYASQRFDEDTGVPASLEARQRAQVMSTELGEATSFMRPEILAIGRARVDAFLAADRGLRTYAHYLDNVLRNKPHTLDAAGEALLAAYGLTSDTPSSAYRVFANAELPWPTVKLADGSEVKVDQVGYEKWRASANRADRKTVMDAFFRALKSYEGTLGVLLYGQMKRDAVDAKTRRYPDSLTQALDEQRLPRAVYDQLVAQANATLPTLHRYFRLRARMLGVPQMQYYDIYPPLVSGGNGFDLAGAKEHVLAAAAPLGEAYVADLRRGIGGRWMDAYPRPRKDPGGYMNGYAYDVHPYILMNWHDDYESLTTLAHEWGHAMHSVLANGAQPFVNAHYATFTAEIASTLNEALLLEHMLAGAKSDDERLLYLGSALEQLRGTFYRQAMFAEFERETHARVDRGETLTGEAMSRIYGELLRRYHGDAVAIDDAYAIEWAFIPHFYRAFYVYQYATSVAASALFAERIRAAAPGARERYLDLLRAGGSDYPYELVKRAGVDLAQPAPYQALAGRMNSIMDRIEAILPKRS